MAKGGESGAKEGAAEKTSRFFSEYKRAWRGGSGWRGCSAARCCWPALSVWAGVNAVQAGGFELARRHFAKKRGRR